jgi:hypothetical protein
MLDFITIPVTVGICVYGFYKLIELFVRKKERLMLIEKITLLDSINTDKLNISRLFGEEKSERSGYMALKIGSLLIGVGLGLLVGYIIFINTNPAWEGQAIHSYARQLSGVIYGSTTLFFGGLGLVTGFIIEHKMRK